MKNGSVLLAIGIGAFLGSVVVCGGVGAGFLWIVNRAVQEEFSDLFSYTEITDVDYLLTGPDSITLGERATFVIEVTNTGNDPRTIHSLDFYTELVGQGTVTVSPMPTMLIAPPDEDYGNALLDMPLPPGTTERFDVTFTPSVAGTYVVNIDVNFEQMIGFIERFHTLHVQQRDGQ